jgi:hypothetical protein
MSVHDIIYITPQEFKDCKQNLIVCNKITDIYTKLLQGYDCFTKPDLVHLKFPSVPKSGRTDQHNQHANHRHHKHSSQSSSRTHFSHKPYNNNSFQSTKYSLHSVSTKRPQLKALSEAQTDTESVLRRQLKGLLNVINKNNFNKIFNKIKPLIADDNTSIITDVILDTACFQVFYIKIFLGLLDEVIKLSSEQGKSIVGDCISKFINDFISDELYMYKTSGSHNKYHEFCLLQKHKCLVTSRNHVMLELIKSGHCQEWTVQSYCDNLLMTVSNLQYYEYTSNVESNIDIIICMVKDIKTKDPNVRITQAHIDTLKTLLNNSQRLKFIVDDIAKLS